MIKFLFNLIDFMRRYDFKIGFKDVCFLAEVASGFVSVKDCLRYNYRDIFDHNYNS